MIPGKDQYIIRMECFHVSQVLINSIGSARIPLTVLALLIWRKDGNTANVAIQIPRNANADVCIQAQRLVLCQHAYCIHAGIDTVA